MIEERRQTTDSKWFDFSTKVSLPIALVIVAAILRQAHTRLLLWLAAVSFAA